MTTATFPARRSGWTLAVNRQRLWVVARIAAAPGILIGLGWDSGFWVALLRAETMGLAGLLAFGLFEQRPRILPDWIARWVLQVVAVAAAMPVCAWAIWLLSTPAGAEPFWHDSERVKGFAMFAIFGLLIAPWAALAALVRQKEALAREATLRLDLARSEFERHALDARLQLMQSQVTPHFLFNTLANVQALVDAGSPQAAPVLRSLTAYLRAAVPRLDETMTTLGRELVLVEAYLDLMQMRFPDRLAFAIDVDPGLRGLNCPPMALLTLVENAVRHGIDPSEDGGRIDLSVMRSDRQCVVRVSDTGVGLHGTSAGLGTGLTTLRERLQLAFDDDASLSLQARQPRGAIAELRFPLTGMPTGNGA